MVEHHLYLVPVKSNVATIDLSRKKASLPYLSFVTIAESRAFVLARVLRAPGDNAPDHFATLIKRQNVCHVIIINYDEVNGMIRRSER